MHQSFHDPSLPKPVGPYSKAVCWEFCFFCFLFLFLAGPAVAFQKLVFVSGQVGEHPTTGELAGKGVAAQTKQTFANMQAILQAAGSDLQYVLKCGVFLIDMEDFSEMNQVYGEMFGDNRPARSTVQVSFI
jgi:2-iminobutanoate/2-iminopropanoate deaminase